MFVYTGKYSDRIMEESHPQGSYFFFSSSLFYFFSTVTLPFKANFIKEKNPIKSIV